MSRPSTSFLWRHRQNVDARHEAGHDDFGYISVWTFDDLPHSDLRLAVADAVDGAVPVVGDQNRTILHLQHIDRAADIFVVFQKARDQRLDGFYTAVLVQFDDDDVAAELLGPVPRAVPRDDDRVLVALRELVAGVEPHAERGRVRAHQADGCCEFAAGMSPAEFGIGDIALVA